MNMQHFGCNCTASIQHYNFPNRILQSSFYSLVYKQFSFSALQYANHFNGVSISDKKEESFLCVTEVKVAG